MNDSRLDRIIEDILDTLENEECSAQELISIGMEIMQTGQISLFSEVVKERFKLSDFTPEGLQ